MYYDIVPKEIRVLVYDIGYNNKLNKLYFFDDVIDILCDIYKQKLFPYVPPAKKELVYQLVNFYFAEDILEILNEIYEPKIEIFANYVYLDHAERQAFATTPHEFLINQFHHTI